MMDLFTFPWSASTSIIVLLIAVLLMLMRIAYLLEKQRPKVEPGSREDKRSAYEAYR